MLWLKIKPGGKGCSSEGEVYSELREGDLKTGIKPVIKKYIKVTAILIDLFLQDFLDNLQCSHIFCMLSL